MDTVQDEFDFTKPIQKSHQTKDNTTKNIVIVICIVMGIWLLYTLMAGQTSSNITMKPVSNTTPLIESFHSSPFIIPEVGGNKITQS